MATARSIVPVTAVASRRLPFERRTRLHCSSVSASSSSRASSPSRARRCARVRSSGREAERRVACGTARLVMVGTALALGLLL